jgi:hypothetical protein
MFDSPYFTFKFYFTFIYSFSQLVGSGTEVILSGFFFSYEETFSARFSVDSTVDYTIDMETKCCTQDKKTAGSKGNTN